MRQPFDAVPFFCPMWVTQSNRMWDVDSDPAAHDCAVSFWNNGRKLAVATIGRDLDSLRAEFAFEQDQAA